MTSAPVLSAAILCGGQGRRMGGTDKSQLLLHGRTLLDHQLEALAPLTPHIMLIERRTAPPRHGPFRVVNDVIDDAGALGGIYTALEAATTDRVLVLACDMPYVTTPFLTFLSQYHPTADAVVPADADGRHALCAVFHRRAAATLAGCLSQGHRRVSEALSRLDVRLVAPDAWRPFDHDGRLLFNLNSPGDYHHALASRGATCA